MVMNVPLDYTHVMCLGVIKKLLTAWINGLPSLKIGSKSVKETSRRMLKLKHTISSEFSRKPRTLDISYWKATEYHPFIHQTSNIKINIKTTFYACT